MKQVIQYHITTQENSCIKFCHPQWYTNTQSKLTHYTGHNTNLYK